MENIEQGANMNLIRKSWLGHFHWFVRCRLRVFAELYWCIAFELICVTIKNSINFNSINKNSISFYSPTLIVIYIKPEFAKVNTVGILINTANVLQIQPTAYSLSPLTITGNLKGVRVVCTRTLLLSCMTLFQSFSKALFCSAQPLEVR